jgi:glycosyltransferase involved in cell wall biosynthesis
VRCVRPAKLSPVSGMFADMPIAPQRCARWHRSNGRWDSVYKTSGTLQLGILDTHPIQYHTPLYQRLAARGNVKLAVLYLYDHGLRPVLDPSFGVPISWNIELLAGYRHDFLNPGTGRSRRIADLCRWIRAQDIVVIYGHSNPWMLFSAAVCRSSGIPYLLRGDSGPSGPSAGIRRAIRNRLAHVLVSASAGGLAVGKLNEEFYATFGAPRITFAPHSVDNDRFADTPETGRDDLLARWGLDIRLPVIMFCGKLVEAKRPLDLAAAVSRLTEPVSTVFVGDGKLADPVRVMLAPGRGVVTGFVNQTELPSYYHAADILVLPSQSEPWGLVVNEAMAAGVLPVVSDRVGAGPDLVEGLGEIYPCGDVDALAAALRRALSRAADPQLAGRLRRRVDRYSVEVTAVGFEQAAAAAKAPAKRRGRQRGQQ